MLMPTRTWTFTESLLQSAIEGNLTRSQAEEWLEGKDRELALKLIDQPEVRRALRYLLNQGVTADEYALAWKRRKGER